MGIYNMADEMIDIYDSEMNMLGIALKSQAHKEGLWHKVFHCCGNERCYIVCCMGIGLFRSIKIIAARDE